MKTTNLIKTLVVTGCLFLLSCEEDVETILPDTTTSETPATPNEDTSDDNGETSEEVIEGDTPIEEETPTEVIEEETPVTEDPVIVEEETPVDPVITPIDPTPPTVDEEVPGPRPITSPEETFIGGTNPSSITVALEPSAGTWQIAFEDDDAGNFTIPTSEIPTSAIGGSSSGSTIFNSLVITDTSISLTDSAGNIIASSTGIRSVGGTVINFSLSTDPSTNQIWFIRINETGTRLRIASGTTRREFEFVRI